MKKHFIYFLILIFLIIISGCSINTKNPNNEISDPNKNYVINFNTIGLDNDIPINDIAMVVANNVIPATVEISCTINYSYLYQGGFGFIGGYNQRVTNAVSGLATGFIINEDGYIITNAHVVTIEDEEKYKDLKYISREIYLNFADDVTKFEASIIDYDTTLDLCILKMDTRNIKNVHSVTFFNLTDPRTESYKEESAVKLYYGEAAIAVGNANGYGISVTKGIVSAPLRVFSSDNVTTLAIQTDAAINSGNSGGPLCNANGYIIGVNSFKIVTSTSEALGYAIPSYVIIEYIDKVNKDNKINISYNVTNQRK